MATRFLVAGGNGAWNDNSNWAATSGAASGASFPVAGDTVTFDTASANANMTVNVPSACTSIVMTGTYAGTLTFNSTLTVGGTITFLSTSTIAGTSGTLIPNIAATLTSGGKTLTCAMTFGISATYTLADDWTVNGLVTAGVTTGTTTINGVGRTLICAGGFHQGGTSGTVGGTAKFRLSGGTWDSSSTGAFSNDVDLAGNVTVSGAIVWGASTKTITYVSGTITTTGSLITCTTATTWNTAGVTWNSLTFGGTSITFTNSSTLAWSGILSFNGTTASTFAGTGAINGTGAVNVTVITTLNLNNTGGLTTTGTMTLPNAALTFAGSAGWTVGTLTNTSYTASRTVTLTFGRTYTVTTAFNNVGTLVGVRQAFVSSSAGNKVVFTVTPGASLNFCDATDIDSSGGLPVISTGGLMANTLNWQGLNRFLVGGGTGNWDSTTNWAYDSGGASGAAIPIAANLVTFDTASANANITVNVPSACTSIIMTGTYAGTLTFNSTLTVGGTITFLSTSTIAGTTGTLIPNVAATLTSGGKTITCAMTLGASVTYTLADDWVVNGLVTAGVTTGTTTINGVGRKVTCAGGFHQAGTTATVGGTAKLVMAGGTWDSSSTGAFSNDVDLAGNVTVSGAIVWGASAKTLTYVSGTITTAGSTITCNTATTWNTAGVTWSNLTFSGTSITFTNSSTLAWSGTLSLSGTTASTFTGAGALNGTGAVTISTITTLTLNNTGGLTTTGTMTLPNGALTFAGSAGWTVGTLTNTSYTASRIVTLTFGRNYTVNTAFNNVGTTASFRQAFKSSSPGNKVVFTVIPATSLTFCDPTDIDSSGGTTVVSTGGVLTNTINWSDGVTRYLVTGGTGNWNSTTNWSLVTGGASGASFPVATTPVIIDSNSALANITVNVASAALTLICSGTYAGTMTFDSTLTVGGTITFVSGMTLAGTAGTLIVNLAPVTLTSAGKTLPCGLKFAFTPSGNFTLGDDWVVNGLVSGPSSASSTTLSGVGRTLTCNGGLTWNGGGSWGGTVKVILGGGTVTMPTGTSCNMDIAGNVTISGSFVYGSSCTLTYVSGTVTTTGSTLNINNAGIYNTAGMVWNDISVVAGASFTLNSLLSATGTLTLPNSNTTISGPGGFTVGTLTNATYPASRVVTLTFGATYTVTGAFNNVGTTASIRQGLKSSSPGNKTVFKVTPGASYSLNFCDPTDIDSSGGQVVVSNGGLLTHAINWETTLRFLVAGGDGNWDSTTNWSYESGGASGAAVPNAVNPVTFDTASANANMTVNVPSVCTSIAMTGTYAGTMTFNSTLTVGGAITFLSTSTIAGTAGTLIPNISATLTSGGKTITCAMNFITSTYTLADDWTVSGLVTAGVTTGTTTINGVGRTLTCAGGFHQAGTTSLVGGTAKLRLSGGTWDSTSTGATSNAIDLAGNVTVSGAIVWGANGRAITYVSGTITTAGSTITTNTSSTWNTTGMTWGSISFIGANTWTISSTLAWSGLMTITSSIGGNNFTGAAINGTGDILISNNNILRINNTGGWVTTGTMTLPNASLTFGGSSGWTVGTLTNTSYTGPQFIGFQPGNTYTVTTLFTNVGTTSSRTVDYISVTSNVKATFIVVPGANVAFCNGRDIDSSGGLPVVTSGTVINCINWSDGITRFLVPGGDGNWNSDVNWSIVTGGAPGASFPVAISPVIMDSNSGLANIKVNVPSAAKRLTCSGTYTGTMTFDDTLTVGGDITFVSGMTIAGTAGTLISDASFPNLTSGGKTLTCGLTLPTPSNSYILVDDWVVNGLVSALTTFANTNINGVGRTLTCNGGFSSPSGSIGGSAKLRLTGGTLSTDATIFLNLDLAGNVTITGNLRYSNTTLTYVSGTITTTGSTLILQNNSTYNTAGMAWDNINVTANTFTLQSLLTATGTMTFGDSFPTTPTISGPGGFTAGTLKIVDKCTLTFAFGATYTVTDHLYNVGTDAGWRQAFKSSSPGNQVIFNVSPGANQTPFNFCDPTDIDSSGGDTVTSNGAVITNTINWSSGVLPPTSFYGNAFWL